MLLFFVVFDERMAFKLLQAHLSMGNILKTLWFLVSREHFYAQVREKENILSPADTADNGGAAAASGHGSWAASAHAPPRE